MNKTKPRVITGWRQVAARPGVRRNAPRPPPKPSEPKPLMTPAAPPEVQTWEDEGGNLVKVAK